MPTAVATGGASLIGNLIGGGKASSAQQTAANASQNEMNQVQSMISNFQSGIMPWVNSLLTANAPTTTGLTNQQGAQGALTGSAGLSAEAGNYGNSAMNQQLATWDGLKPQELNALTTNAANSGMSDIATARSSGAFGANQNAVIQNALQANRQGADAAAVNIGSNASQQEVGALESANNAALGGIQSGITGLNQTGGEYTSLLGLNNNTILSALGLLNPVSGGANTLAGLSGQNQTTAAGYGNPYGAAGNSAGQLISTLTSGGKGSSASAGTGAPNYAYTGGTQLTPGQVSDEVGAYGQFG